MSFLRPFVRTQLQQRSPDDGVRERQEPDGALLLWGFPFRQTQAPEDVDSVSALRHQAVPGWRLHPVDASKCRVPLLWDHFSPLTLIKTYTWCLTGRSVGGGGGGERKRRVWFPRQLHPATLSSVPDQLSPGAVWPSIWILTGELNDICDRKWSRLVLFGGKAWKCFTCWS